MDVKQKNTRKTIMICIFAIIILFYISLHISHVITVSQVAPVETESNTNYMLSGQTASDMVQKSETINYGDAIFKGIEEAFEDPFNLFPVGNYFWIPFFLLVMVFGLAFAYMISKKEFEHTDAVGKEEGSAKWNDNMTDYKKRFEAPYDPKKDVVNKNAILAKDLYLDINNKRIQRNLNMFVLGGPGTGKSFKLIKPNMAQMNSSAIITDPKGELFECMAKPLIERGIKVKVFSTSDMVHSNCYNPFDYVYDENGNIDETKVATMVNLFLKNASSMENAKKSSNDPFWDKAANAFVSANVYYLLESDMIAKEEINFSRVFALVAMAKVDENNGSSQSQLDVLMAAHREAFRKKGLDSKAATMYFDIFKLAPSKTANSILISCQVDLKLFNDDSVKNLTRTDYLNPRNNVELDKLGDEQTYLFINIPAANGTYNFLVALLYSQTFTALYNKAEKIYPKKYYLEDKNGYPVVTMLDSEKEAQKTIEYIKDGKITEIKTVTGGTYFQIKRGKKVIIEKSNRKVLEDIKTNISSCQIRRGGIRMPWHVRCLMDEFSNIASIPDFGKYLSTMRSYEISCVIVIQALSQLKDKYDKRWEEIIADCDTFIFLGATDNESSEYVSKMLGDTTIRVKNTSFSKKNGTSYTYSNKKRPLMTPEEVRSINENGKDRAIVRIRDVKPFLVDKYNFLDHPNFRLTGNASDDNILSVEEMEKYFYSIPIDVTKIKTKKKRQRSLLETAGISVFNKGQNIEEDLKENDILNLADVENKVIADSPTEVNRANQEKEITLDNEVTMEDIKNNEYVPDAQIYGVSEDATDNAFYF